MIINVGKEFSENPAGRSIEKDGDDSGEAFRERYLKPSLESLPDGEVIEIILDDGVISYGSSFISEAFGALVRQKYISAPEFVSKLKFTYKNKYSESKNTPPLKDKKPYMEIIAGKIIQSIEDSASMTNK